MAPEAYWVYILVCDNNTLYTGYTNNLNARFSEHLSGAGAKYTRSFKPLKIAQSWQFQTKSAAMKAEAYIKTLSRMQKDALILEPKKLAVIT